MAIRRKLADGKRRCGRESIVFPFQSSLFLPLFLFLMLLNKIVIIQEKPSSAESEWHQPSLRVRTDTGNDGPPEVCVSMQSYGFQTARFCISVTHGSLIPLHPTPKILFWFRRVLFYFGAHWNASVCCTQVSSRQSGDSSLASLVSAFSLRPPHSTKAFLPTAEWLPHNRIVDWVIESIVVHGHTHSVNRANEPI